MRFFLREEEASSNEFVCCWTGYSNNTLIPTQLSKSETSLCNSHSETTVSSLSSHQISNNLGPCSLASDISPILLRSNEKSHHQIFQHTHPYQCIVPAPKDSLFAYTLDPISSCLFKNFASGISYFLYLQFFPFTGPFLWKMLRYLAFRTIKTKINILNSIAPSNYIPFFCSHYSKTPLKSCLLGPVLWHTG